MTLHCHGAKIIKFFKAACDKNRHQILHLIKRHGQMNATEIIKRINLSQPTVSHHLKILCDAEILIAIRKGKETYYSINKNSIFKCCHGFSNKFCTK